MSYGGHWEDGDDEYVKVDFSNDKWYEGLSNQLVEYLEPEYESYQMWAMSEDEE